MTPRYLKPKDAAALVAMTVQALKSLRLQDRKRVAVGEDPQGPPWREHHSPGGRTQVVYRTAELEVWADTWFAMSGSSPPVRAVKEVA